MLEIENRALEKFMKDSGEDEGGASSIAGGRRDLLCMGGVGCKRTLKPSGFPNVPRLRGRLHT